MIRTAPRTELSLSALALAALLVAGLSVGFVAGQVAPDLVGAIAGTSASVADDAPALTQTADFGIRHLAVTVPLSEADDYGIRLLPAAAPLAPADDYGIRHTTTTPLTPADDYGIRHSGSQP
jgi:hypothetical protein